MPHTTRVMALELSLFCMKSMSGLFTLFRARLVHVGLNVFSCDEHTDVAKLVCAFH